MRTVRFLLCVALVVVSGTGTAAASTWEERADRAISEWEGSDSEERVRRLRERYGLVPTGRGGWTSRQLEAIERGAGSLPSAFFERIETPIFLERRGRVCSFAQGNGTPGCPRFDEEYRTFYVYDVGTISRRLANRVMPKLDAGERTRLVYRRVAVHAVVALLDRRLEWSERRAWRTINGWESGDALNRDWWGYSRPLGRRSAHLDFVTFAEEYFARPEDLLRERSGEGAASRLANFDPNDSVVCRMMTRSRLFRKFTRRVAPGWKPPKRVNHEQLEGDWNAAGTGCPSFEEWADWEHVRGLDLVYASASSEHPESMFGHLLVHIEYGSRANIFRGGFEPIYQFGAVTGTRVNSIAYFAQGLFGGFPSVLEFNTLRSAKRLYLRYDRRNLRKYRLNLTREQRLRAMQRIWEAQRHVKYPYYFFQHNCASFVVDLMRPVLGTELEGLPSLAVMPTDVLDAFGSTTNPALGRSEEPFLEQRYRRFLSSEARAIRAVEERRDVVDELGAFDGRASNGSLDALHESVESMRPVRRKEAYDRVAKHLKNGVKPASARKWVDYLYYSSVVERYFVERARFARLERLADNVKGDLDFSIQDRLRLRRKVYRIDDLKERLKMWRRRMRRRIEPITEALQQKPGGGPRNKRLRASYRASLSALSKAISRTGDDWNGREFIQNKEQRRRAEHFTRQQQAIGPSGAWRGAVGAFGARGQLPAGAPGVTNRGGFELHAAFLRDEFGEFRVRGLRPEIESRSFDLELQMWLGPDWHRRMRAELIVYRFFTLKAKPTAMRDGLTDAFGWGVDGGFRHDGARGLPFGGWISGGLIFPIAQGEIGTDYLALGTMAEGRADVGPDGAVMVGGRAFLRGQVHLYGNYGNLGRLKLETHQYTTLDGNWEFDATASLSTRHAFGDISRRPLWLVPYVEGRYTSIDYTGRSRLFDVRAGLRFEFPL